MRVALLVTLFALTLTLAETTMAQDAQFPTLPKGAGKIDADAKPDFEKSKKATKLQFRILRQGGGQKPKATNTVKVHYHGWLDDGKVFDSSYQRGEPIEFPLDGVIPGWTEGMQYVGKGGMIELDIPAELGYGARGAGGVIPPNARLHFLVELLDVR